jgi:hypothetical protein
MRKGVQKKWKVGINKKENGKVKNKFKRATTSTGGGPSLLFTHFIIL